jgi:hypothetical protein
MGESHTKGLGYLADASSASSLGVAYKEARNAILHQAMVEKGVVGSASVLWTDVEAGKRNTAAFEPLIDRRADALLEEVKAAYGIQAMQRGVAATEPTMTEEELVAANLVVQQVPSSGGGRRGRGGRRGAGGPSLPDEFNSEFSILLRQEGITALQIRDFLSGEFTPLPLVDVMAVLRAREAGGSIQLVPKER